MIQNNKTDLNAEHIFEGIPVSPGVAIGKAFVLAGEAVKFRSKHVAAAEVKNELSRLDEALKKTRSEIKKMRKDALLRVGNQNAEIFETHDMILADPVLLQETKTAIQKKKYSADFAFYSIIEKYQEQLQASKIEHFRERTADLRDIKTRVIRKIQGDRRDYLQKLKGSAVIIARDLTPSDTMSLDRHKILGFVTDLGGKTSHSAIMARSFGVPAAVGMRKATESIRNDDRIILDGIGGKVYINPDKPTLDYFKGEQKQINNINKKLASLRDLPARTLDGKDIDLAANLEFADEIDTVIEYGARGVGLYRTDHFFMAREDLPSEEEQFEEYRNVAERLRPYPVIIRTMDVGGDKNPGNIQMPMEENPYLGFRALRICLDRPDIFQPQLRAILRASTYGNVKMLFPMVSSIEEVQEIKAHIQTARNDLKKRKIKVAENIEIGAMIEIPSAAMIADVLARELDFLSIGTNDLVQYMLAVDRGNERIAYLYKELHPAVLRMIRLVIRSAHKCGAWVGLCGEMGGNPLATPVLLGLGLDEISVSPVVLPEIKRIIRALSHEEAVRIADRALSMASANEIEEFMRRFIQKKFKSLSV